MERVDGAPSQRANVVEQGWVLQGFGNCPVNRPIWVSQRGKASITPIETLADWMGVHAMQHNIIERLFSSFEELETAIESARQTLKKKPTASPKILDRLDSYGGVIAKQRNLATELCRFINDGNWDEVSRHVSLINGLSAMIRDDARAILSTIGPSNEVEIATVEDDITIC